MVSSFQDVSPHIIDPKDIFSIVVDLSLKLPDRERGSEDGTESPMPRYMPPSLFSLSVAEMVCQSGILLTQISTPGERHNP